MGDISLSEKLKRPKAPVRKWNNEVFGNFDNNIGKFEVELNEVEQKLDENEEQEEILARWVAIPSQVDTWYKRKGEFLKQL